MDAVCDGEDILIPGIMEHIERAGIHSGDSISVYPAQTISEKIQNVLVDYTRKLARSLHVIGLINIQFIVYQDEVYAVSYTHLDVYKRQGQQMLCDQAGGIRTIWCHFPLFGKC